MKYYCLVSGLPDIGIDDNKPAFDIAAFREEVHPQLSEKDNRLIDLFYLKFDNRNLLSYLRDKEVTFDGKGKLSKDELADCLQRISEAESINNGYFPPYFKSFVEEYKNAPVQLANVAWENRLAGLYYHWAMQCRNKFIAGWFEFNLNLNNILAVYASRKYNLEIEIVGNNEVAQSVKNSSQRDLGLTGTIDHIEDLQRIADEPDLFEREKKIDLLKWKWLDEESFFAYFTVERVFAYLIRLEIIERWAGLNHEAGKRFFRELIDGLKNIKKS
jgi:hypothetical protein